VKLAQAVRSPDGLRLRRAAVIQRAAPWTDDDALGQNEPERSWVEIRAALECGEFHGRNAAIVLPMNVCELRAMNVPQGDDRERRAMIANELADDAADRPAPMDFDFWEVGGDKGAVDGFNVNVLSVSRPWITQVTRDCQQARLDCWAVDGAPLAMARAVGFATRSRSGERVLAVDWGFSNTTLCVVGHGRPLYARRIHDCNFRKCLESIQTTLGVTLDHAQHLVDVHGVVPLDAKPEAAGGEHDVQLAVTEAVHETAGRLVEQIQRTLRFVESQRRHLHPSSVWFMGGGASVRNIGQYLSGALRLPVNLWSVPTDPRLDGVGQGRQAALFAEAFALSALAWRAA
jgi:Tfp pilus assembly PilM family ATPase